MISRRSPGAHPASRQGHSRPTARDPALYAKQLAAERSTVTIGL